MRHFLISGLLLIAFSNAVNGQIDDKIEIEFDSILLSPECKLDTAEIGKIFNRIEILSDFPGGHAKWFDFANKRFDFKYVVENLKDSIRIFEDSVVIKFVVTRNGDICNIKFLKGNPILGVSAIKLLKSSPRWIPGIHGSRNLNTYRTLRLDAFIDRKTKKQEIKKLVDSYRRENVR